MPDDNRRDSRRQLHEVAERRFALQIRQLRNDRGWSQRDLADRLADEGFSLHASAIAKIEQGQRPIRIAEAHALATALGATPLAVFRMPAADAQPHELAELQAKLLKGEEALDAVIGGIESFAQTYARLYAEVRQTAAQVIAAGGEPPESLHPQLDLPKEGQGDIEYAPAYTVTPPDAGAPPD